MRQQTAESDPNPATPAPSRRRGEENGGPAAGRPGTMGIQDLSHAVFRLGRITSDIGLANEARLRSMASILSAYLGDARVALCATPDPADPDAPTLRADAGPPPNGTGQAVRRPVDRADIDRWRALPAGHPHGAGEDLEVAVFHHPSGGMLIALLETRERGPSGGPDGAARRSFDAVAPFLADCFAQGWQVEPDWALGLNDAARTVLGLVLTGLDDEQIAGETGLTYHSVRAHLKRLFKQAGVRSRLHLMQAYRAAGGASSGAQGRTAPRLQHAAL